MSKINVAIYSIFRDNEGEYIDKYFERIAKLKWPHGDIRVYAGEGDSIDATGSQLASYEYHNDNDNVVVVKQDTGRKRLYHTPDPYRMLTRATTGNAVYDKIASDGCADLVLHLESDLEYNNFLLQDLWNVLKDNEKAGCASPYVWVKEGGTYRFYDQWAFRNLDGEMFPPYNTLWYKKHFPQEPFPVQSTGSCVLFYATYLHEGVRLTHNEEIRGLTMQIRIIGGQVLVDPNSAIVHPSGDYRTG